MSLWGRGSARRDFQGVTPYGLIPPRGVQRQGSILVNEDTAHRHSAVWACSRLRADLVSTFPLDVYRDFEGIPVEMPKPPVLVNPGGDRWDLTDWMWATTHDLDTSGNAIGIITEVNALGLPSRIDLQPIRSCSVVQRRGQTVPIYKIDGKEYPPEKIWHERQFPIPGLPVGMSPIMYAAWSIGEYLSIQQFALDWFGGGAVPKARMKNVAKKLKSNEIETAKQWYRDVITNGDLLVHGVDWEYDMIQAQQAGVEWLDARAYGLHDICRFFGVPADLVEAAAAGRGTINYANITQRNLQFLIHNLQPMVVRREIKLSNLLPRPRYVKLNRAALLAMDPSTQADVISARIDNRTLTVTEGRAFYDLPPLTPEQEAEFNRLFPPKSAAPSTTPAHALEAWLGDFDAPRSPLPLPADRGAEGGYR